MKSATEKYCCSSAEFPHAQVGTAYRGMGQEDLGCWRSDSSLGLGTLLCLRAQEPDCCWTGEAGTWMQELDLENLQAVNNQLPKKMSVKHSFPTKPHLSLLIITAVINKINKHIKADDLCNKIVTKSLNYFAHNPYFFQGTQPYSCYWDEREPSRDCTCITYFSIKQLIKVCIPSTAML